MTTTASLSKFQLITGLIFALAISLSVAVVPLKARAAINLIPCSGVVTEGAETIPGAPENKVCTFSDFIKLGKNIIDFLIFVVAPLIAMAILVWGGFLILTAGGSTEQVGEAKKLFWKALTGLLIAMCAWIIVKTILILLGYNTDIFPAFYK